MRVLPTPFLNMPLSRFYRTQGGAEIDLVIDVGTGALWAVEIKRSAAPMIAKGFHIACEDSQPRNMPFTAAKNDLQWGVASRLSSLAEMRSKRYGNNGNLLGLFKRHLLPHQNTSRGISV